MIVVLVTAPQYYSYIGNVYGQRVIRELESNIDSNDIAMGNDTINQDESKKKKNVPTEVRAWTINPIYGERTSVDVDTLQHGFQGNSLSDGLYGEYNSLGNLGSPRESRIYMLRPDQHDYAIITNMDQLITPHKDFKFYNTKSPYMNLSYDWCGSKQTGFDNFKAIYTNNAGKRFNIGGIFQYMYGQGYYDNQSTAYFNSSGWASYTGDKYDLHLRYTHYDMKMMENGGITDPTYITNPSAFSRSYSSDDIPTWLSRSQSRQHIDELMLNHRYHIGFLRVEGDSANRQEVFVPVTSFFHSFTMGKYHRRYSSYEQQNAFYTHDYLDNDTTLDSHDLFEMTNRIGITLHEGFNKYAVAGLSAFVGFRDRKYEMPDTLAGAATRTLTKATYKENDVLLGGQLIRSQGTYVHYNADVEFVVAGDNAGDITANGHGELNVPFKLFARSDTAQLSVDARISHLKPNLLLNHFHSNNLWWDKELDKEMKTRVSATLSLPRLKSYLTFGIENTSNFTYLKHIGLSNTSSSGDTFYSHDVGVRQAGSVQVIMLRLNQRFQYKPIHFDNVITFQKSTDKDVLPLPTLSLYSNLYFTFVISKVLKTELGLEMKYFTKYEAPDYSPILAQFINQNDGDRQEVGNYPLFSAYINFALKKLRFHLTYYHFNQSDGRYFTMPRYPMNPKSLHFGISWNFYD